MEFDFAGARKAGATDEQIAKYLADNYADAFDFGGAFKAGASAQDVVGYLESKYARQPEAPKEEGGDFLRGAGEAFQQVPQLGYGLLAGAGAVAEKVAGEGGISTAIKQKGVEGYQRWGEKVAEGSKESDSWSYSYDKAKEGDFNALVDWFQHGLGYAAGQGVQILGTAGLGALAAKGAGIGASKIAAGMVAKESARIAGTEAGAKLAAEELAKVATANVAAKIGQNAALAATAFGMEGGEIYGDLVSEASKAGRELSGADLGKAFVATTAAGGLEFVGDRLGLDLMLGKKVLGMTGVGGMVARGVTGAATGVIGEGATEYGQTLTEEYGKGKDPFSPEALRGALDAAALGALGGAAMGGAGGVISRPVAPQTQPEDILSAPTADEAIAKFTESVEADNINADELLTGLDEPNMAQAAGASIATTPAGQPAPPIQQEPVNAIPPASEPVQQPDLGASLPAGDVVRPVAEPGPSLAAPAAGTGVVGGELAAGTAERTGDAAGADARVPDGAGGAAVTSTDAPKFKVAMRLPTGEVVTATGGETIHAQIFNRLTETRKEMAADSFAEKVDFGFVDNDGRYYTREEATAALGRNAEGETLGENAIQQSAKQTQPVFGANSAGKITLRGVPAEQIKAVRDKLGMKGVIIGKDNAVFPKGADLKTLQAAFGSVPTAPVAKQKKPRQASTDLLQRIKQLGGINSRYASDVTGEQKPKGAWKFAFGKNGLGLDDLATQLAAEGFNIDLADPTDNGGVNQLGEMIRQHIGGERAFKAATQEAAAETMLKDRARQDDERRAGELGIKDAHKLGARELADAIYAAEDAIIVQQRLENEAEAEAIAAFSDAAMEEGDINEIASTPEAVAEWLGVEYEQGKTETGVQQAVAAGQEEGAGTDRGAAGQAEGTGFLQSYTNAEVLAREKQAEDTAAEDKAAAERASEVPFTLSAQSQPRPSGVQEGMFTADGRATAAAESKAVALDKDMLLFHGTSQGNNFSAFDVSGTKNKGVGSNVFNQGHYAYLTQSREAAQWFADKATENADLRASKTPSDQPGEVLEFTLKKGAKVLRIENMPQMGKADALIEQAKKDGVDAIMFRDPAFDAVEGSKRVADMLNSGQPMDTVLVLSHDMLTPNNDYPAVKGSSLTAQTAQSKKLEVLKAQAQGKITGDQGAALKELADAGEHAAVDEVLKPTMRDATTQERIASEKASPVNDLNDKPTGWKRVEGSNNDSVTLVSYDGKKAVPFVTADKRSGTASVRMNAEAHAYAIDNPYQGKLPEGELVTKPMFAEAGKIDDFGEKLGGARKDLAAAIKQEYSDSDIASLPLSKIWPADLAEKIEDKFVAAFSFAARQEIPAKPRVKYKVDSWVKKVKMLRDLAGMMTDSATTRVKAEALLKETKALDGFNAKISLLESIDREQWKRIGKVHEYPDAYTYENVAAAAAESSKAADDWLRDVSGRVAKLKEDNARLLMAAGVTQQFDKSLASGKITQEQYDAALKKGTILPSAEMQKAASILSQIEEARNTKLEVPQTASMRKIPAPQVTVEIDGKRERFEGAKSVGEVIDRVNEKLGVAAKGKRMEFEVRGQPGAYFINKKGDPLYRKLKMFDTSKEALDFKRDNYDELVAAWEAVKDSDNVKESDLRTRENRERTAEDWRKGKDVTPEQFITEFGFRGVEFGLWVKQGKNAKERQGMLNAAYDALMDLSSIINVPPKALSLEGTLGLGFGSRGSGAASAHFEPDTLVINLTKTRGAGTLAHEWFHSLDNYFQLKRGKPATWKREDGYITYNPENYYVHKQSGQRLPERAFNKMIEGEAHPDYGRLWERARDRSQWEKKEGVRTEVGEAFADLVKALNGSPMAKRASLIDKGKSGGYWSRIIERGARSFENYVIHKMMLKGYHNDYLANVTPANEFQRDAGRYPYLLEGEIEPVAEAFDTLFQAIKTKETDKGVALFSRSNPQTETPEFSKWFGDSKVIDADGKPMAVYHHTYGDFSEFNRLHMAETRGRNPEGMDAIGIWFTDNSGAGYIGNAESGANVIPAYLSIKKPYWIDAPTSKENTGHSLLKEVNDAGGATAFREMLKARGYDGVIIMDSTVDGIEQNVFVALEPEQIKSAIGNNGQFDPNNSDIRFSARKSSTGLSISAVESIANPIAEKLKNIRTVKVVERQTEIPGLKEQIDSAFSRFQQDRTPENLDKYLAVAKDDIEGAYVNGELYLVASNLSSAERVTEVLRHEVAHLSVEQMLEEAKPGLYDSLLKNVRLLDKSGNKYIRELAAAVDRTQPGLDERTRSAEIIAQIAERGDHETDMPKVIRSLWQRISDGIKAFYKLVFGDTLNDQDVRDIVAQSFRWARGEQDAARVYGGEAMNLSRLDFTKAQAQDNQQGAYHEQANAGSARQTSRFGRTVAGVPHAGDFEEATRIRGRDQRPLAVFRGSAAGLAAEHFGREALGYASGAAASGRGVHFSTSQSHAAVHGDVQKYYLDIRNPFVYKADDSSIPSFDTRDEYFDWRESLRKRGHDGIVVIASHLGGGNVVIAFDPHQVIAPAEPMFSRQGSLAMQGGEVGNSASWDSPEASKLDDIIYTLQDKHIDMKRVVQAVKDAGGKLIEKFNPYLAEELFHGRAAKRTQDFVNTELKPLLADMRLRGLTVEELDQYLHARHAKEANALIAERDPDMPDGGSGMTNAEADEYMAVLGDKKARLEAAAARVDSIITKTRDLYVSYGLISKDQADSWAEMFRHYVPLMREDHDGGMGMGQGFSIRGKEAKHRTGSTAKVVDILANIALQREKAITRGEKNRVAVALAGLAKLNPNPDFWTFDKPPVERVLNEKTGLVEDRIDPTFKSDPNVVIAKIKDTSGEVHERAVIFNKDNDRAVRMAEAFKNLDHIQLGGVMGVSATITRYFASVNTQYNPVFGIVNITRDVQGMALNLSSTPLAKHRLDVLKLIPSAVKGIYQDSRAERKGHAAKSKWAQLWEELQDEGGMTGYRDLYRNSADRAEAIEKELDPTKWHNSVLGKVFTANGALKVPLSYAQKKAGWLFDWLSDYNQTLEGATRLASYKVALDNGMTKQQAASLAKNITVNFNRKGHVGQQAGAMYAFFNAAMQGTARIAQTMLTYENGKVRLTRAGKSIVYGGMTLGALQAVALAAAGFDDDEPPEFVRERSLILPIGGKKYITLPMPLGFHVFPNLGRIPTEWALDGFKDTGKRMTDLVGIFLEAFNPMGSAGMSLQTFMPTAIDPMIALAENKDWTGKPIYKEDFNSMKPTPGFERNKDTATAWSKGIAEGLNYLTGGTEYTPGAISPTADQLDYLIGQVTGGVGRELGKAAQSGEAVVTGEALAPHKVPLLGRFYGNAENQSSQGNAYYSNLKRIYEVEAEIKGRREDRLPAEEYKRENPEWKLITRAKYADNIIHKLKKQKRELMDRGAEREKIRAIEDRITNEMRRLNDAVRSLEEKEAA